jgi:TIR domain-containing protein
VGQVEEGKVSMVRIFISHNHRDKEWATPLAAQLKLAGADVWIDDWEIRPGESIPGRISEGIENAEVVVLLWSQNASKSSWVGAEMDTALTQLLDDQSTRLIPIRLDEAPLPALLKPRRYLRLADSGETQEVVKQILNLDTDQDLIRAIQTTINESGLEFREFLGYGVLVGCPRCGADVNELEAWQATDYQRDDTYAGAECRKCGWQGGGEL